MINKILWILLLSVTSNLFAQKEIKGYILDRKTNEPIAYAILSASSNDYGTYSDSLGYFKFNYSSEDDSIRISHLGYKPIIVNLNSLNKDNRIYLDPNPIGLNDVVVKATKMKRKEIKIGNLKNKEASWLVPSYALIYATYIPFPNNETYILIKSISLKLQLASKNYPLRIRLLKANNSGRPSEDLLTSDLIISNYTKTNATFITTIDISRFNLPMPKEGLFIGLEWIDLDGQSPSMNLAGKRGPYVLSTKQKNQNSTRWIKSFYHDTWLETERNSTIVICMTATKFYK